MTYVCQEQKAQGTKKSISQLWQYHDVIDATWMLKGEWKKKFVPQSHVSMCMQKS